MKVPPESIRYCLGCQKNTIWKYNKVVGHSRCLECGGMYSTKEEVPDSVLKDAARKLMPWIYENDNKDNNKV